MGIHIYDLRNRIPSNLVIEGNILKVDLTKPFGIPRIRIFLDSGYEIEMTNEDLEEIMKAVKEKEAE